MSSEDVKTKQDELRARILQSTSLPRLKTTNTTSLAALEKLKADLEAKRQGKGTPPPLSPQLASSAPALPSAGSLLSPRSRAEGSPPEVQEAGKEKKDTKEKKEKKDKKEKKEKDSRPSTPILTVTAPPSAVTASNSPRIISSPLSPRDTEVTVVDLATEFEEMMNDLKFTDAQRDQMGSLPESHKQTILLQWKKKKKVALAQRRSSHSPPPEVPPRTRPASPLSHSGRCLPAGSTPPPVNAVLLSRLGEQDKPLLAPPTSDGSAVMLANLEARKQEKMDALKKLKEELALKRQLAQRGIQREELSPEALQALMKDLEEQRRVRRETREQKMMAKVEQMKKDGKISSLADMQEAIRQANEMRQQRAERALARKRRKSTKKLILKELEGSGISISRRGSMIQTPQDAAMLQETKKLKRLTRQMDLEAKEIKIDSQLTNFLTSMVNLEEEWKKQEQLRIQRQVEFEMLQKEHAEAQERLKRSEDLISDTKTRLSSIAAALAAAAGRHSEDTPLQGCQNELSQLLEQLGMEAISVVDQRTAEQIEEEKKAAIQKRTEELEKEAEESGSMGGLLAQLKGTKLKKVDPAEVEKQKLAAPPPPALGESLGMFTSLQDTLRGALEMRKLAIMDSDSDDDDDDDDFWDDDDDDDFDDLDDLMSTTVRI